MHPEEGYGMAMRHGVDLKITRLLLQVGLMCGELGRSEEAVQIIRSVRTLRDDIPHPGSALAFAYLRQGRLREAEQELDAVLAAYPDHQLGKALLGLVYRETGRPNWQDILHEVIEDGREEWSIRLARNALGAEAPADATPRQSPMQDNTARMQRLYA
jgi:tetratricopeptide (TPR) repeat protein